MRSLLSQIGILRGCTPADLSDLGRSARIGRYPRGGLIADQLGVPTSMYFVAFGRVRLKLLGDHGRELIVSDVEPGGCFGEESLDRVPTRCATAVALDEATVVAIPAEVFAAFLGEHPRIALNVARHLSRQLYAACDSAGGLGLLSVEERLLRTLERLAQEQGSRCHDGLLLHRRPTHQELAARVGACRETVTRTFKSLSRRGLVVGRGSGFLLTHAALQRS